MLNKRNKYSTLFSINQSIIMQWLTAKGFAGQGMTDGLLNYFKPKSGLASDATLFDHMNSTLDRIGYAGRGTFQDKLQAFYMTKTGKFHPKDAEFTFYTTFTLDFT